MKKLSKRHNIFYKRSNINELLQNNPKLKSSIDSFCEYSGGNKSTHSIVDNLRNKFGNDLISFSDDELISYIEERKKHFKDYHSDDLADTEVGKAGLNPHDNYEDQVADYITHGK